MVRLVDLGRDGYDAAPAAPDPRHVRSSAAAVVDDDRPNPNLDLPFAAALSCYPITSQLARSLDLNSLHDLSRTCRQVRADLLDARPLLMGAALRCRNERADPALRLGDALHASVARWSATRGSRADAASRLSGGRLGACARDMVGECRRCGAVVCRNCVVKAPPASAVRARFRRLCRTCMKAPPNRLTVVAEAGCSPDGTAVRYSRSPCSCDEVVWICQPCGQVLRSNDTSYLRGWAWRTRYSDCGGIGAGLGEGNEGVQCGRGGDCLAAKRVEREIDCDAGELAALEAEMAKAKLDGREWAGSSYSTHEIVGIGGRVKKKLKQSVPVGAAVKEYENERTTGKFLQREQEGANRSWCSWCDRVVLGKKDLERPGMSSESVSSQSSASS